MTLKLVQKMKISDYVIEHNEALSSLRFHLENCGARYEWFREYADKVTALCDKAFNNGLIAAAQVKFEKNGITKLLIRASKSADKAAADILGDKIRA